MNKYESMLITSATLDEEQTAAVVGKFKSLIEENGTLESVDEWGKRRLAYPIEKEDDGVYTLFHFEAPQEFPAELERVYRITDGVLRSLIIAKTEEALAAEANAKVKAEAAKADAAARAEANAKAEAAAKAAREKAAAEAEASQNEQEAGE